MTLDRRRSAPNRSGSNQDLWPKWMWVAVPVLVVVVVAGLWWAIFSPSDGVGTAAGPTATLRFASGDQPTQAPTAYATLPPLNPTATRQVVPLPTFTPGPEGVSTPDEGSVAPANLVVGGRASVSDTGGVGLNLREGAGTAHGRVKMLPEGTTVDVIGGPTEADGYTWWQVQDTTGTSGWAVEQYLSAQ